MPYLSELNDNQTATCPYSMLSNVFLCISFYFLYVSSNVSAEPMFLVVFVSGNSTIIKIPPPQSRSKNFAGRPRVSRGSNAGQPHPENVLLLRFTRPVRTTPRCTYRFRINQEETLSHDTASTRVSREENDLEKTLYCPLNANQ